MLIDYDQVKMILAYGERAEIPIDIDKKNYSLKDKFDKMYEHFKAEGRKSVKGLVALSPFNLINIGPFFQLAQLIGPFAMGTMAIDYRIIRNQMDRIRNDIYSLDKEGYIDARILGEKNIRSSLIDGYYHTENLFDSPVVFDAVKVKDKVHVLPFLDDRAFEDLEGESVIFQTRLYADEKDSFTYDTYGEYERQKPVSQLDSRLTKSFCYTEKETDFVKSVKKANDKDIILGGKIANFSVDLDLYLFDSDTVFESHAKLNKSKERRLKDFFARFY